MVRAARAAASSVGCSMDHAKGIAQQDLLLAATLAPGSTLGAHRDHDSCLAQPVPLTPAPIYTPKGHWIPASPVQALFPSSCYVRSRGCLHGNSVASVA